MQELLDLLFTYARAVWMKRWYVLAVAWLFCIAGWAVVMTLPDVYRAAAKVNIDTQSVLSPLLRGIAIATSSNQEVRLMVSTLLSRPNLEQVTRITDLDLTATTDSDMDALIKGLGDDIKLTKLDRSQDLYEISYANADPAVAKRVVQAVLTVFVETTLGENREDSVVAKRFLDAEIREYEQRLKESEQRVVEFKRSNVNYLSSSGQDFYGRLQQAIAEVQSAKLNLTEAEKQRESIQDQIEDEEDSEDSLFSFGPSSASSSYDARIASLEARLDEMSLKYTERHPDMITIRHQIEDLEEKREEELSNQSGPDGGNPIVQSLMMNLSQAGAQVAALGARVSTYEQRVEQFQKMVHTIPAIEAEMADLNRDYGIIKSQYNQLLKRREQAQLTQKANQASDDIEFEVIEPARVPFEPSGPPRVIYMSAVLIASALAGIGFGLFLVIIKPTVVNVRTLALMTGLPVLGTVARVQTSQQMALSRRYILLFVMTFFMLLVSYFSLLLYELLIAPSAPTPF